MDRPVVIAFILALTGCVHATRYFGPNGERMVEVHCGGLLHDFGDCHNRAREECGGNYLVAGQSAQTNYVASADAYGASVTPVTSRNLVVQCVGGRPWPGPAGSPASSTAPGSCHADDDCDRSQYCTAIGTCVAR